MRLAHLVGPSPEGTSLVLATDDGDELALVVDDRLREAVRSGTARGGQPRPGRLENDMDTSFSPREIQTRVRAGETLEAVAEAAGLPYDRVERFAAPVLAEREHIALMALAASVRRRGETSGHRNLRGTAAERLLKRGIDVDAIAWDAYRLEDGRWAVTADYRLDETDHHATFWFDARGRFSVAGDDDARWLIGEQPPVAAGSRRRSDTADEPTVDLSDELALVRATQEAVDAGPADEPAETSGDDGVLPGALSTEPVVTEVLVEQTELTLVRTLARATQPAPEDDSESTDAEGEEPAGPSAAETSELTTLYAMMGSDGYSEDSPRVYAGLSDASAVPETAGGGWEPAIVIDYPVEPGPAEGAELPPNEHPDRSQVPMDDKSSVELSTPVDPGAGPPGRLRGTDEPAPPYARNDGNVRAEEAEEFQLESEPPPEKKTKRKRASVPSWDEIMFGGPKPPT